MLQNLRAILVVDDEPFVLSLVAAICTRRGYSVLTAKDGQEAFDLLQAQRDRIALLLTDLTMPRKDGWELIRAARELVPNLPVVAMSGYTSDSDSLPAVLLSKPFTPQTLLRAVEALLPLPKPPSTEQNCSPALPESAQQTYTQKTA